MDFDASSYPKLPVQQQQNPLDTIAKVQGIQKNAIGIDADKLKLYNEKYNVVHRSLGNLVNEPELSGDHFINTYQDLVKAGVMTPDQAAKEMSMVPTKAGSKSPEDYQMRLRKLAETQLLQAQEVHNALGHYTGQNATVENGNQIIPGVQGRLQATGQRMAPAPFQQTGASIPKQLPVGTPGFDTNNQPSYQGPATSAPTYIPPSSKGDRSPRIPTAEPQNIGPANAGSNQERIDQGNGILRPAPSPGFSEGVKGRDEDQLRAKGLSSQNIPALQAYKLIQGLRSGPTTGPWNEAVAALKANHIIPIEANDPTAIYEMANKKLSMIVQAGGTRSDAALAKSEESSPSVKTQINPALVKLTRDLIAQNRTEITLPNEFEGNDFSKYGAHRSKYATKIDQKAAGYDLLPKDEKVKIWKEMKAKKDTAEGKRFFDTLRIMRKHEQFDEESLAQ